MATAHFSDKWQVTVPLSVRKALGLKPRAVVDVEVRGNQIIMTPIKSVRESYGVFREAAQGKTKDWDEIREQMYEAVSEEHKKKMDER